MGQRHQAYLRLPEVYYNPGNPNNKPQKTLGLHHQWLYGFNAVSALYRLLMWFLGDTDNKKYMNVIDMQGVFNAAYSFDHETAYFHQVHTLKSGETENPLLGDNNNGITIIDLVEPRYCFMSIGYLECLDNSIVQPRQFIPINVIDYLQMHYPDWHKDKQFKWFIKRVGFIESNSDLLTIERIKQIFPAMYEKQKSESERQVEDL